eukprot:scaffold125014_cov51-Attheya_sp.AAC.2
MTVGQQSQISQVTTGSTMMGGRNEQSSNRQGRRIGDVQTVRHIKTSRPGDSKNLEAVPNTKAKNECDMNADTCCLGTNFVI